MDLASHGSVESVVEYQLHFLHGRQGDELAKQQADLLSTALQHSKDYIWQKDSFTLKVGPAPWQRSRNKGHHPSSAADAYLWGSVKFGDNVEDEWFITWLLLSFCCRGSGRAARIFDNDGEFLLIEAALHLPKWLKPEVADNRIWLYDGAVHILPLPSRAYPNLPASLSTAEALQMLQSPDIATLAGPAIQAAISARLAGHPAKAHASLHHARCLVPARVAHALRQNPQMVAPATEAFYHRTPAAMRAAARARHVPAQDMVSVIICFSKCLYAQLSQQTCQPPKAYPPLPPLRSPEHRAAQLGMMLTLGFEMLANSTPQPSSPATAQQGVNGSSGHDSAWPAFLASLQRNGYFGNDIPGSARYKQRLAAAQASFAGMLADDSPASGTTGPRLQLHSLLAEPFDSEQLAEDMQGDEDSEAWMAEGAAELDARLQQREQEAGDDGQSAGRAPGQEADAADVAARIKGFMAQMSSVEGAEVPPGGPEDEVSIEQQRFLSELGSVLGFDGTPGPHDMGLDSDESSSFYSQKSDSDSEDDAAGAASSASQEESPSGLDEARSAFQPPVASMQALQVDTSAILAQHEPDCLQNGAAAQKNEQSHLDIKEIDAGVAAGSPSATATFAQSQRHLWSSSQATDSTDEEEDFDEQYAAVLRGQLQGSSMSHSFQPAPASDHDAAEGSGPAQANPEEIGRDTLPASQQVVDELMPLDVDLNLVQSLLASYGAQDGLPGPAGNLAGLLGLQLQHASVRNARHPQ